MSILGSLPSEAFTREALLTEGVIGAILEDSSFMCGSILEDGIPG